MTTPMLFDERLAKYYTLAEITAPFFLYYTSAIACKPVGHFVRHLEGLHSTPSSAFIALQALWFKTVLVSSRFFSEGCWDAALCKKLADPYDGRLGIVLFPGCEGIVHLLHWDSLSFHKRVAASQPHRLGCNQDPGQSVLLIKAAKKFSNLHIASLATDSKVVFNLLAFIRKRSK